MLLIDRYAPDSLDKIKLDDKILDTIIAWINSWNNGLPSPEKPALLLTGYPGTGKTTAARCICQDAEWNLMELNASDIRNKKQLSHFTPEKSLMGNITCILFDEADSFDEADEGGEYYIKKLITNRQFPIILTANNIFKVPKEIKILCETLQIYRPSVNALKVYLYEICSKEGLNPSKEILEAASQSQDYRMALSMIENNMILSKNHINISKEETVRRLILNLETNIKDPKQLLFFLDANISHLYDPLELYQIYEILSRVDILRRRNQEKHAIALLKTIPKTILEEFELISPVYIDKKKGTIKT